MPTKNQIAATREQMKTLGHDLNNGTHFPAQKEWCAVCQNCGRMVSVFTNGTVNAPKEKCTRAALGSSGLRATLERAIKGAR